MKNKKMIQKVMNYLILASVLGTVNTAMAANSGIGGVVTVNHNEHYIGNNGENFNSVVIDNNLDKGIIGGYTENGNAKNNTVYINNGTINGYIYGGYSETGNAIDNSVLVNNGNFTTIRGGGTMSGNVSNNSVKIIGCSTENAVEISGGSVNYGSAFNNIVEINGGEFGNKQVTDISLQMSQIYGGSSNSDDNIDNNYVKISGGTFNTQVQIAGGYSMGGTAQGNVVEISGGIFNETTDILAGYGGKAGQKIGTVANNVIIISNTVDLKNVNLYGKDELSQSGGNNNLVFNNWNNDSKAINRINRFDNIYFENLNDEETKITINSGDKTDISTSNIHLNSISQAVNVNVNDKLTITMSGLTAGKDIQKDKVSLGPDGIRQGVATSIIGNIKVTGSDTGANDMITVTVTDIRAQKQTAITTESQAAAAAFVNQGNELISDSLNVLHDGEYGINTFARVSGNNSKYDTGSYVDINGWNSIVGVANTKEVNAGKLIYGAFFENGSGNYNTYNDFNSMAFRGDGNVVYNGGGLAMRYDNADGVYTEASLRAGTAKNELSNALLDTHGNKHGYKTENAYYAAHIGIGKIIKLENDKTWDIYGKYFHTHHEGDSVSITNQIFDFDSVDSDKLRIGTRFNEQQGEKLRSYYGLAWEYEFSGDVGGTAAGHAMYTPSLEGSTVIGEVGFRYTPGKESPWYFDANLKGYVGMQEGISGSVQAVYSF